MPSTQITGNGDCYCQTPSIDHPRRSSPISCKCCCYNVSLFFWKQERIKVNRLFCLLAKCSYTDHKSYRRACFSWHYRWDRSHRRKQTQDILVSRFIRLYITSVDVHTLCNFYLICVTFELAPCYLDITFSHLVYHKTVVTCLVLSFEPQSVGCWPPNRHWIRIHYVIGEMRNDWT